MYMFKKSLSVAILTLSAIIFLSGCGSSGTQAPGLMKGSEAAKRMADAAQMGMLLCQIRTGRVPNVPLPQLLAIDIANWYGIDNGRMYRTNDVENCMQYVKAGVALDPYCSYLGWKCPLNPVNKITGAN